jgi:hypothetical protein
MEDNLIDALWKAYYVDSRGKRPFRSCSPPLTMGADQGRGRIFLPDAAKNPPGGERSSGETGRSRVEASADHGSFPHERRLIATWIGLSSNHLERP